MTSLSLGKAQELMAALTAQLIDYTLAHGYQIRLGEAYRPQETQDLYYQRGNTKTKNSQHTLERP